MTLARMEVGGGGIGRERLRRVQDGFERAWGATRARSETHHVFLGEPVRFRVVGATLAGHVESAFAHLRQAGTARVPRLTVDLWDAKETGVPALDPGTSLAGEETWGVADDLFAASHDRRVVSTHVRGSGAWLDRRAGQIVGWVVDGDDLSAYQRSKPLHGLLSLWASDLGVHGVHAALVGRDRGGVLVPGGSGAGKSTVALACLCAGHTYLGDDWVGLTRGADGSFEGHGLYGVALLEPGHATRFPLLQPHVVRPRDPCVEKSVVPIARAFPERLGRSMRVRALAFPRVVEGMGTRIRPASKREALMALVPTSIFMQRPRGGRAELERLGELVRELPTYWLQVDSRLDEIPRGVDTILAGVGMA